jgi:hypothetical protein
VNTKPASLLSLYNCHPFLELYMDSIVAASTTQPVTFMITSMIFMQEAPPIAVTKGQVHSSRAAMWCSRPWDTSPLGDYMFLLLAAASETQRSKAPFCGILLRSSIVGVLVEVKVKFNCYPSDLLRKFDTSYNVFVFLITICVPRSLADILGLLLSGLSVQACCRLVHELGHA